MGFFGYHLMLDCKGANENIAEYDSIYGFVKELVDEIKMEAHGEPIIEWLLPGDPKEGFSLLQLITTSSITGHFMSECEREERTFYIDVFSCKEFNPEDAIKVVKKYFDPTKIRVNFVTRDAN